MPKPFNTKPIVKKRKAKFIRAHQERHARLKEGWRKPKGIDSRVRRRYRGARPMVKIGYGSAKKPNI